MTLTELIAALNTRLEKHGDVEVNVIWEGQKLPFWQDSIYLDKEGLLLIDGDGNSYKDLFAADPTEGDDEIAA